VDSLECEYRKGLGRNKPHARQPQPLSWLTSITNKNMWRIPVGSFMLNLVTSFFVVLGGVL
jgi:hypothetical protein